MSHIISSICEKYQSTEGWACWKLNAAFKQHGATPLLPLSPGPVSSAFFQAMAPYLVPGTNIHFWELGDEVQRLHLMRSLFLCPTEMLNCLREQGNGTLQSTHHSLVGLCLSYETWWLLATIADFPELDWSPNHDMQISMRAGTELEKTYSMTPLHCVAHFDFEFRYLLGPQLLRLTHLDINRADPFGNTPLHVAVYSLDIQMSQALMEMNMLDMRATNAPFLTPAQVAMRIQGEGGTELCQLMGLKPDVSPVRDLTTTNMPGFYELHDRIE